ncbi:MAG: LpxL/LpxP family acyltransferase [Promethearchaeota archaeon]
MAHIYYADKKFLRSDNKKIGKKSSSGESFRTKKASESWGKSMGPVFKVINWIGRKRIYKPIRFVPFSLLNGLGHLIGRFGFGTSKSVQRKMKASFNALYPGISEKRLHKFIDAATKYMAMLFLDITFRFPLTGDISTKRFYRYMNPERLDKALQQGNGVIIPILHIGEFLHAPNMMVQYPYKRLKIGFVVSVANLAMYENANRKRFDNLYAFASTKFSLISPKIESLLKGNNVFVVYHDYSTTKQLRTPFILGKFPYLIHSVQSYISLHKRTGAVILPAISHPDGVFGKTKLEFLDNTTIIETSKKYWNESNEEFHGRLSTEINRKMYPYVRKYAHLWEEVMRLAVMRCADKVEFSKDCTIHNFLEEIQQKMLSVLDGSFEPDRPDNQLKILINEYFPPIINSLQNPDNILRSHKTFINLSLMSGISELLKLCSVAQKELNLKDELQASKLIQGFISKIKHYQNF